ncbi:MAG: cyclomaltodextrinase [Verrucomicrobiales bacterium]
MAAFHEPPDWITGKGGEAAPIFYQIFPDRFVRSGRVDLDARLDDWDAPPTHTGYKGGDLWGVIDKLDYLQDVGITAIWFNPIFQSASNHRYHTHDYFQVDPLLGGNAAFDALIVATRARGMRVVLDGVFNHASRGFFPFSDIAEHQEKSAYVDWFRVNEFPIAPYDEDTPASYDAWWGLHALPALNTDTEAVREFLWSVGTHWIERGADGWRLDVPNEIRTDGFWDEFRRRVREVNPDAYLTGEIWHAASGWVGDHGPFDGVMNYPLTTSIIAFAIGNRIDETAIVDNHDYDVTPGLNAGEFADRIDWLTGLYGPDERVAMLNLLDSHDTGRIMSMAGGQSDLVILCLALLLTMPGAPCIYYGTEVGLEGGPDPDNRRGFPWDRMDDAPLLTAALKDLIALRQSHPGLRSAEIERLGPMPGPDFGRTYLFARGSAADRLVIAINHADEADVVPLETATMRPAAQKLWGEPVLDATNTLTMPPRSVGVWKDPR